MAGLDRAGAPSLVPSGTGRQPACPGPREASHARRAAVCPVHRPGTPPATHARIAARRTLTDPAATARALALAICEVEAGLRSARPVLSVLATPTSTWASAAGRSGCWPGCCTPTCPPDRATRRQRAPRWAGQRFPRTDRTVADGWRCHSLQSCPCTTLVLVASLPLGEQMLGGLGLALQPGQPRLLIHPDDRLTSRQPPSRYRDDLPVGCRLLGQHPAGQQLQALPHLSAGSWADRGRSHGGRGGCPVGPGGPPGRGCRSAPRTALHLGEGPTGGTAERAMSSVAGHRGSGPVARDRRRVR